ncbi:hypothetical protein B0H16DRAFT_1799326 [Mycena metata]|uniref:Uncharacterized protein n=1 Tax=Mycena metata TaxID=1033252 RepID=A0AAD7HC25_9AGAR|nr:hypothetical protein B0H16DRAFT_1799326 [Mycena metata]
MANEYQVAREIQDAFLRTCNPHPLYHDATARLPDYTPGCSSLYITDQQSWTLLLNATARQEILAHRHILIKGLTNILDLGIDSFDLMGIPRERALNMEDMALRTAQTPGSITTTAEQFLSEAMSEDGLVLRTKPLPMHLATAIEDPLGLLDLNMSDAALTNTQSLTGCQYGGPNGPNPLLYMKWATAACAGVSTPVYCERFATVMSVKAGKEMIYLSSEKMDQINALDNWRPGASLATDRQFEGVTVEAGDVIVIRPNSLCFGITREPSLKWVRNFHATATILDSIWAHIHTSLVDIPLPHPHYRDAPLLFIQIQAYWWTNIKLLLTGKTLGWYTSIHMPNIQSWSGLLRVLCVGNIILMLEAVDLPNYLAVELEERRQQATFRKQIEIAATNFANFRAVFIAMHVVGENDFVVDIATHIFEESVLFLATAIYFYAKNHVEEEYLSELQKKLEAALELHSGPLAFIHGLVHWFYRYYFLINPRSLLEIPGLPSVPTSGSGWISSLFQNNGSRVKAPPADHKIVVTPAADHKIAVTEVYFTHTVTQTVDAEGPKHLFATPVYETSIGKGPPQLQETKAIEPETTDAATLKLQETKDVQIE